MRTATRLAVGLAIVLPACGAASQTLPPDAAILPGSDAPFLLNQCSRQTPSPGEATWTPGPGDISRLEAALAEAVRPREEIRMSRHRDDLDWAEVPLGWRRQYVGIVRGGRRFIYGNFYPRRHDEIFPSDPPWPHSAPSFVCDGGPVFFGAEYDVEAGTFTQIEFNGP